jgi:hypothetical protein
LLVEFLLVIVCIAQQTGPFPEGNLMSNITSFAELDGQYVELLPDRIVMSIFRVSDASNDLICLGTTVSEKMGTTTGSPSCQSPDPWL